MLRPINCQVGDHISLDEALRFSLQLAAQGVGLVEPNPSVGSVLFNENTNKLISFGHHQKYGGAHAEANCLQNVSSAKGLTLVVTLEPCSHYGKTSPCADLIIAKKPKKLIYITKDPNPLVSGKGLLKIQQAGIKVVQGDNKYFKLNRELNHKFFYAFENKRTYIHLKWAESADKKTAVRQGNPWITSLQSQEHSHYLRAQSQAVLIGRRTLESDNPSLDVRKKGYEKPLKVIIFDPDLKSLTNIENKKILHVRSKENIIFLCKNLPQKTRGYSFLKLHVNLKKEWDLRRLSKDFYKIYNFQSILVEGGAFTISQFIRQKIFNRISVYKSRKKLETRGFLSIKHPKGGKGFTKINVDSLKKNPNFTPYTLNPIHGDELIDKLFD